ncbi:DUF4857 domain-containing protein [Campylobacter sp. RM9328]|uniref:DUF4857 domain-containing protein n=1 Tax=Campylobacter sp. RM9328 TaxID=1705720 RepID=UPI0014751146|nr:DUF4857 domain-containing protein [Campylobacter sp. RM9328]
MRAIFLKEFSRLWLFLSALFAVLVLFFSWFSFDFFFKFNAIHPEAVIWYQYVFFENEPERLTLFVVVSTFVSVALAQFLPQRNRIKCLLYLPISSFKILLWHYLFALLYFVLVWLVFGLWLLVLSVKFYPDVISIYVLINWSYYCFCGVIIYLFASAILLDMFVRRAAIFGVVAALVCVILIFYINSFFLLVALAFSGIIFGFNALLSHKQISLKLVPFFLACATVSLVLSIGGYEIFKDKFADKSERYYIFYSPSLKEFIYQENLGGHYFAYKSVSGKVFQNELDYKNELAFNYFMDLKQQGKLPVTIDGKTYSENEIRASRMSMTLSQNEANPPKIPLYPLFNPNPKISNIPSAEDMLYFGKNALTLYHHDGEKDEELTHVFNQKAKELDVKFPVQGVFGRFTNLKIFDEGLFFKDAKGDFYNIKMYNNKLSFKAVSSLKNYEYLHIVENDNTDFLGLAFKDGKIYFFDKNYVTLDTSVDGFELGKMRLRVGFDPKFIQIRLDDGDSYKAFVFDKFNLEKLGEAQLKR